MTIILKMLRGPNQGREYELNDDEIIIGSGRNSTVIVQDNDVSTAHCRLLRLEHDYEIDDLDSRYGTFLNGQPIYAPTVIPNGSIIELGGQIAMEYTVKTIGMMRPQTQPLYLEDGNENSQPCLAVVENGKIQSVYLLESSQVNIGRSVSNDMVVQATDISRSHIKLIMRGDKYVVCDLDSRNGSFLNGEPLKGERDLVAGDVIRLGGSVHLHYVKREELPDGWLSVSAQQQAQYQMPEDTTAASYINTMRNMKTRTSVHRLESGDLTEYIFIAYAREDWERIVATIVINLEDAKQSVWAEQPFTPGSEVWNRTIEQAQSECWMLIVVVSPQAMQSETVRDTYRYFYNREKPILLVDFEPVERLPIQLSRLPIIPFDPDHPGHMFRQLQFEIIQLKQRYGHD